MIRPAPAVVLLALSACTPSPNPPEAAGPCSGFVGDAASGPDFTFLALNAAGDVVPLEDGGALEMLPPPQGGLVTFVGVRATNIDGCGLQLEGVLRDEASQEVQLDVRTVDLIAAGPGWAATGTPDMAPSRANFANVFACPNQWSTTALYDHTYGLEVTIQDRDARQAKKTILVRPACDPEDVAECACICAAGYVLGQACSADASIPGDAEGE